jgi:hypothetical protein
MDIMTIALIVAGTYITYLHSKISGLKSTPGGLYKDLYHALVTYNKRINGVLERISADLEEEGSEHFETTTMLYQSWRMIINESERVRQSIEDGVYEDEE